MPESGGARARRSTEKLREYPRHVLSQIFPNRNKMKNSMIRIEKMKRSHRINARVSLGFFVRETSSGVFGHSGNKTVEQGGGGDAEESV